MNKRQKILIVDDSKTVFMKADLLPVMGDNQMIQDLPLHLSGFWSNRTHGKNNGKGSSDPGRRNKKYHD